MGVSPQTIDKVLWVVSEGRRDSIRHSRPASLTLAGLYLSIRHSHMAALAFAMLLAPLDLRLPASATGGGSLRSSLGLYLPASPSIRHGRVGALTLPTLPVSLGLRCLYPPQFGIVARQR